MDNQLNFDIEADELEIFLADVDEHLQAMENGILDLEQTTDIDVLNAIFRAAHTLKALAGTVGHHPMAELTHTVENLFDALRQGIGLTATQAVIDEMLATVDALKVLRDEIATQEPGGIDITENLERLRALLRADAGGETTQAASAPIQQPLTPAQAAQVAQLHAEERTLLEVEVVIATDAFAPAARLLQAVMALMEVSEVIAQNPSMADLSDDKQDGRLWLILATASDANAIEALLGNISELAEFRVQPYMADPAPASGPEPRQSETPSSKGAADPGSRPARKEGASASVNPKADTTVRISVDRLDTLMNLVGELVTDRTRLMQIEDVLRMQYGKEDTVGTLGEMAAHFSRVVEQLQDEVMRARMLPIKQLFDKFPRLVRDVARIAGKQVNLVIEGEATELDRSIIEVIGDPLIHLLRNAVDHGIEPPEERSAVGKPAAGTLRLTAAPVEGQIVITVEEDGRGIDPEKVRQAAVSRGMLTTDEAAELDDDEAIELIFRPNLSTARQITDISGRGVGMDVVRANVERLSGSVVVDSRLGRGTTFRVTLPLTLAIVQSMLVSVGNAVFAIPLAGIIEALYLSDVKVSTLKGKPAIRWRDSVLPLLELRQAFADARLMAAPQNGRDSAVITVAWGKIRAGLVVDKIIGQQEIVVKSFSPIVGKVPGLSGCAILGDGRIALIVDVPGLINTTLQARKQGMAA
jgi:two-component system chemotaxis sensor kinase CheA